MIPTYIALGSTSVPNHSYNWIPCGYISIMQGRVGDKRHLRDEILRLCLCLLKIVPNGSFLWRHNGHNGFSNHQPRDCLLNCLFSRRWKKTSKLLVTGLCEGISTVTGEFPAQMASNAENFSTWCICDIVIPAYVALMSTSRPNHTNNRIPCGYISIMQEWNERWNTRTMSLYTKNSTKTANVIQSKSMWVCHYSLKNIFIKALNAKIHVSAGSVKKYGIKHVLE